MASILLLAGEADVVAGDKHLAGDVQLVEWGPQGTARVAVQALVPGQPKCGTVALVLGSSIQVSGGGKGKELGLIHSRGGLMSSASSLDSGSWGSSCEQVVPRDLRVQWNTHTERPSREMCTPVGSAEEW